MADFIAFAGALDLDHARAEIGEHARAVGAREHARKIDYGNAGEQGFFRGGRCGHERKLALVAYSIRARTAYSIAATIAGLPDGGRRAFLARLSPPAESHKLKLIMEYARRYAVPEVPDPYYGGPGGFERVPEMLEDATEGLLDAIRSSRLA
jgi:protein-tyrosine phosphatase